MSQIKILIVEDEELVASDIKESLQSFGYGVIGRAASGDESISMARELSPDLVLMDIQLPGELDGISATAMLRNSLNIPVIYLTAYADPTTLERAKVTEPYGYVLKPFKELELRTAIELALYKHSVELEKGKLNGNLAGVEGVEEKLKDLEDVHPRTMDIYNILKHVKPFCELDQRTLTTIAKASRSETYSAGELIAFEGEKKESGFIVASGRIAMTKSSSNGKELIVELLPAGDSFGVLAALDTRPYEVSLKAQVESSVLWVPRALVLLILDKYPELSRKFFHEVFDRLRNSHNVSRALAHDRVEVRVASALLALIPKLHLGKDSKVPCTIHMTRQELADLTGSTSETVIRVTRAMEREGLLDLSQSKMIRVLEVEGLQQIAEN